MLIGQASELLWSGEGAHGYEHAEGHPELRSEEVGKDQRKGVGNDGKRKHVLF